MACRDLDLSSACLCRYGWGHCILWQAAGFCSIWLPILSVLDSGGWVSRRYVIRPLWLRNYTSMKDSVGSITKCYRFTCEMFLRWGVQFRVSNRLDAYSIASKKPLPTWGILSAEFLWRLWKRGCALDITEDQLAQWTGPYLKPWRYNLWAEHAPTNTPWNITVSACTQCLAQVNLGPSPDVHKILWI